MNHSDYWDPAVAAGYWDQHIYWPWIPGGMQPDDMSDVAETEPSPERPADGDQGAAATPAGDAVTATAFPAKEASPTPGN